MDLRLIIAVLAVVLLGLQAIGVSGGRISLGWTGLTLAFILVLLWQ